MALCNKNNPGTSGLMNFFDPSRKNKSNLSDVLIFFSNFSFLSECL